MIYNIIWDKKADEELCKLELIIARRITKILEEFAIDPASKNLRQLKGVEGFRLRAGDYRIILKINHNERQIRILKIGHRKNIYERQ